MILSSISDSLLHLVRVVRLFWLGSLGLCQIVTSRARARSVALLHLTKFCRMLKLHLARVRVVLQERGIYPSPILCSVSRYFAINSSSSSSSFTTDSGNKSINCL